LSSDHVLIAEQNSNRVTERDLSGKVLWERSVPMAFQCQRLRNGNTFMAGRNLLQEVDRTGKEVLGIHRPEYLISARRFRDGQTAFVTSQGVYIRLDASGKEAKNSHLPLPGNAALSAAEVLPGDRILASVNFQNRVTEFDADGHVIWQATVSQPGNLTRLANGHTIVVSANSTHVTELNRSGAVVGEWKDLPLRPWRVTRR
jgi:outer membrane protein assembly factor BamB